MMCYLKTRSLVKIIKIEVFAYLCRAFQDLSKMLRAIFMGPAIAEQCGSEIKPCTNNYFEKSAKTDKRPAFKGSELEASCANCSGGSDSDTDVRFQQELLL